MLETLDYIILIVYCMETISTVSQQPRRNLSLNHVWMLILEWYMFDFRIRLYIEGPDYIKTNDYAMKYRFNGEFMRIKSCCRFDHLDQI